MRTSRAWCHAVLAVAIAALSFGAIFTRLADAPAPVVAALRMSFSALMVSVASLASAKVRRELGALGRRDWGALALAGVFLALHFILWISSLSRTTVASSVGPGATGLPTSALRHSW